MGCIGRGGMGAVYEAANVRLGRRYAVKVLSELALTGEDTIQRLRREAQIATDLDHSHIVDVIDFNQTDSGAPYMVMELLQGEDLEAAMGAGPLALDRTVFIMRQVCSALATAHQRSVIHRDLKPANIFLSNNKDYPDYAIVLDFGISKMLGSTTVQTQEATVMGTPHYVAPEQAEGRNRLVGAHTDVFAMGAILYRMLAGRMAFDAESVPTLLYKICFTDIAPITSLRPELPKALDDLLARAMAKRVDQRMASIEQFHESLIAAAPNVASPERAFGRRAKLAEIAFVNTRSPTTPTSPAS
jgi:serine/threonine protein kinase